MLAVLLVALPLLRRQNWTVSMTGLITTRMNRDEAYCWSSWRQHWLLCGFSDSQVKKSVTVNSTKLQRLSIRVILCRSFSMMPPQQWQLVYFFQPEILNIWQSNYFMLEIPQLLYTGRCWWLMLASCLCRLLIMFFFYIKEEGSESAGGQIMETHLNKVVIN